MFSAYSTLLAWAFAVFGSVKLLTNEHITDFEWFLWTYSHCEFNCLSYLSCARHFELRQEFDDLIRKFVR